MDTLWMLAARYSGGPVIPVDTLVKDHFPHLSREKFLRKVADGSIKLPMIQIENSQKSAKGVDLRDLAIYLDERRLEGRNAFDRLHS